MDYEGKFASGHFIRIFSIKKRLDEATLNNKEPFRRKNIISNKLVDSNLLLLPFIQTDRRGHT